MSDYLATPESLAHDQPTVDAWNAQLQAEITAKQAGSVIQQGGMTIDNRAFLAGLHKAVQDFKAIGEHNLETVGEKVLEAAQADVHVLSGETKASLGLQKGRDEKGAYVLVGVVNRAALGDDPNKAVYEEFGTRKKGPVAFMRRALQIVLTK